MGALDGRTVWITGSARRLGRVMALGCAREGANIVVHCRSSLDEAEATCNDIRALARRAILVRGDHSVRTDVREMVAALQRQGVDRLDALVNNASVYPRVAFEDATDDDLEAALGANLRGPFICAQECLPLLRRASSPCIVNMLDWALERPYRHYAPYMAAKGGLATLTRALARELAPTIRVNAISPGFVVPPEETLPELRAKIVAKTPLGRLGDPEDVVRALVFLLTSASVTGENIVVDGGRTIG